MLAPPILGALNHLLDNADWARAKLQPHGGRVAVLAFPAISIRLQVSDDGRFAPAASDDSADLTLIFPTGAIEGLWLGLEAAMRHVRVSGNAEFGEALGFVLRNLRWDAEADLAQIVGDTLAPRFVLGARRMFDWQQDFLRRGTENLRDYLAFERPTLVHQTALQDLAIETLNFRDRLGRLEKRLAKLDAALPNRPSTSQKK